MRLEIRYLPVASLAPYAQNARTHSEEQVRQIVASVREWGWTNPVLVDPEGGIIAGHGRVLAAKALGMAEVPTIQLGHLTPAQRRAYVIADNKLALNAGWDLSVLKGEMEALQAEGFDLSLTGWMGDELAALMVTPTAGNTDPDEVPDAPANPISQPGDIWELGSHRIICGDSTDADTVAALLGPVRPHLMVTDPPYGVEYDPGWRTQLDAGKRGTGKVENDHQSDWRDAWALFPGNVAYVWHAMRTAASVEASMAACGYTLRSQIVWVKPHFVISRGHYHPQHECCFYMARDTAGWKGDRKQSTVWHIDNATVATGGRKAQGEGFSGHGTQKPVECMRRPMENNSSPGQAVYEPFSGSGTTIIAAEQSGRICYAVELSPAYVDVAVLRWQAFTGRTAILHEDGRTFAEVLAERDPGRSIGLGGATDKDDAKPAKRSRKKPADAG